MANQIKTVWSPLCRAAQQLSLSLAVAGSLLACVEPADDTGGQGEDIADEAKDGKAVMQITSDAASAKTFECNEWFNCDVDIRASRCGSSGAPGGKVGTLVMSTDDGGEIATVDINDTNAYAWLIGTVGMPGNYSAMIEKLGRSAAFTLTYTPEAVQPETGPICVSLQVQWY